METIELEIKGVFLIKPQIFGDQRGWFYETYNGTEGGAFTSAVGSDESDYFPLRNMKADIFYGLDAAICDA